MCTRDVIRDIFGTRGIKWCWRSELLVRMCGACLSASARMACTRGPHDNMATRGGGRRKTQFIANMLWEAELSPMRRER
jgi:hypothetical protein